MSTRSLLAIAGVAAGVTLFAAPAAHAQCKDPWVTEALKTIHRERGMSDTINGSGTTGECDTNRYGGGRWTSKADLTDHVRLSFACDDPWVAQAVYDVNRKVTGSGKIGDCNTRTYGSWSSYDSLKQLVSQSASKFPAGTCRDPWITQAVTDYKTSHGLRAPSNRPTGSAENGECNMFLYGGGNWANYDQLKQLVTARLDVLARQGQSVAADNTIHTRSGDVSPSDQLIVDAKGNVLSRPSNAAIQASKLSPAAKQELLSTGTLTNTVAHGGIAAVIAAGGGNVIAAGGGNLASTNGGNTIAAGGGNVIAAGGGNVIAAGGGNVIAAGGGNVIAVSSGQLIAPSSVIAAGGGNLTGR